MGRRGPHQAYEQGGTTVIRKRLSFFSVAAISLSLIVVTVIGASAGVAIFALSVLDRKADSVTQLIGTAFESLPEIRAALPPALQDAMNDRREPTYQSQLDVKAHMVQESGQRWQRGVVEVTNRGEEVVTLLTLRVVGVDDAGEPVTEISVCGASPIQIEDEWRGPLLPGATRKIPLDIWSRHQAQDMQIELTDIRVWSGSASEELLEAEVASGHDVAPTALKRR